MTTSARPVATTSGGAGGARARVGPSAAILGASVAVLLGLALWRAGEPNFWGDEVVSIRLARRSWDRLLSGSIYDLVHTPVFYSLLKPWIRVFGEGELRMRLLPIAYRWSVQLRIYRCYRPLLQLEKDTHLPMTPEHAQALRQRLEAIEQEVNKLKVPASFAYQFYALQGHVAFVHNRLQPAVVV